MEKKANTEDYMRQLRQQRRNREICEIRERREEGKEGGNHELTLMHTNLFNAGRRMQNLNGPEESQKHGVKKMGTRTETDGKGVLMMKPRNMRNTRSGNAVSVAADLSRRYLENWFLEKSATTKVS